MASKSKSRRRVLRASCLLAALIVAGSSFAWFTSTDEVTNRLSANADYDVSIVESFAPPANWLPGQNVNKDVYATNTGNIGAFVEEIVSGKLSITKIEKVATELDKGKITSEIPANDLTHELEVLSSDEIYSIEAGAFLAYKPDDSTNVLGRQTIAYKNDGPIKYYNVNNKEEAPIDQTAYDGKTDEEKKAYVAINTATDFAPTTEGLYIFRRSIDVAADRIETFEYSGYYFKDGVYYKVSDLAITSDDRIDLADDGDFTDGYVKSATFNLLRDVTEVATPNLEYDAKNNRLIATYGTKGTDTAETKLKTLAQTLDQRDHELAEARAQLDRSILDLGASDAKVQNDMNKIAQLEAEKKAVEDRIAELEAAIAPINDQVTALSGAGTDSVSTAKTAADTALTKLYGAGVTTDTAGAVTDGKITYVEPTTYDASAVDSTLKSLLKAQKDLDDAKTTYGDSTFAAYAKELIKAYKIEAGLTDDMTYDQVIAKLTYAQLIDTTKAPQFNASSEDELHEINALTVALLSAKEEYNKDRKDAEDKVADWNNKKNHLGAVGGSPTSASKTDVIAGENVTYTEVSPADGGSGLLAEQQRLQAELDTLKDATNGKKKALENAIATMREKAANDAKAAPGATADATAKAQLEREQQEYNTAVQNYETALNAYNKAKAEYDSQNKQLVIYINLADVVTTAGEKDKWQLLPTTVADNKAYFYYTGILDSAETSSKLIDSVELDKNATQDMYKSFDFDLNVELKSAQITYADDNETIKNDAAVDELDATPTLYEPTNIDTAISWS
jgi:predicted ribosomally synthesized peptide with SipW-like signal peptide